MSKRVGNFKYTATALTGSFSSVGATWIIKDCTTLAGGTDITERLGRKVRFSGLGIQGLLVGGQSNAVSDDPYNAFRLIAFIGKPGLVTADWAAFTINSHLVAGQHGVKVIMVDRLINLRVYGADSTGYIPATAKVDIKTRFSRLGLYDQDASDEVTAGDAIYIACISDSAAVSNPGFTSGHFYVTFEDGLK